MGLIPTQMLNTPNKMLSLISKRQEALSDNIANMHTPGYVRKDVDFNQYLNTNSASRLENKMIDKFGISPITTAGNSESENISTEDELARMQENYILYSMAVRNLTTTISEIKTALNVSSNG